MISEFALTVLLALALFLEGIGFPYDRKLPLYLIIVLPLILFSFNRIKHIEIPKYLGILYSVFVCFSFIATVLSVDLNKSFEFLLFYIALGLIFIYVYNNRKVIEQFIIPFILAFATFFTVYSIILPSLINQFSFLEPQFGYQMVFSRFGSHNHLGDFLLLPLVICFYYLLTKGQKYLIRATLAILLFLPYFLFSYSRSAYISFVIVLALMLFQLIRKVSKFSPSRAILVIFVLGVATLFMFSVVRTEDDNNITTVLTQKHDLSYKAPEGRRIDYVRQGMLSVAEKPLFGVGPGNFGYASKKYLQNEEYWTETAHNIFLEILVENGIPAGIVFILIIFELLRRSKKNLFFYLALALLFNFQMDYTYRIYSFFALFVIVGALFYQEKNKN